MSNGFIYSYDRLNRLTSGITTDSSYAERNITYDQAGNIQTLSRVYGGTLTDSLVYNYTKNAAFTDQVQTIQDLSTDAGTTGYAAGTGTYHYDPNGNLNLFSSTNPAAKTYSTTYNLLNLPNLVHSAVNSVYEYDANGEKLSRIIDTNETDYIGGIQYDNGRISFIQTEEGRAFPYSNDTSNYYQYFLADHLGNTRVSFDTPHDTLKVEQQDDYMPFGMEISQGSIANPKNEYLYNRKELQESTGLYDYGARFYDPVVGRWMSVDPMAEKSRRFSPYDYGENNPILNIDPDGMEAQGSGCCLISPLLGTKYAKAAGKFIVNTIAFVTNFIGGENSHRAFSKDPAVRAEAQKELKGYAAAGAVMIMTDGLVGRVTSTFGTTITSNSVWELDASERGFAVEQMLGGNLPYGFPVIDKFENGVATSIKSIDVTADSYTKGNGLFNTLKGYVNKLDSFEGARRGDVRIANDDISSKILEVGIQPDKATLGQWEQIGNALKYAKDKNIELNLKFIQ